MAFRRLTREWPTGTELLVVEVQDGEEALTWDLVAYPMNRANTQLDGIAEYVMTGVLVRGETDARGVAEWAASAWSEAGGGKLEVPAYVAPHDHWQSVDVTTGQWVEDAAIFTRPSPGIIGS